MKKIALYVLVLLSSLACNNNTSSYCLTFNGKVLTFSNDNVSIKLPALWNKIDSSSIYSKALVYSRSIMSQDSLSFALLSVSDYGVYETSDIQINEADFFKSMKVKMLEYNKTSDTLLEENIIEINKHKVSFLKLFNKTNKIYNAHIAFILSKQKQVEIQLRTNDKDGLQMFDCIFSSLSVK